MFKPKSNTKDAPEKSTLNPTKAAKPTRVLFDPWNTSATGHQTAKSNLSGSTSWRDSRSAKLAEQFSDGQRGGKRMYDSVGAGNPEFGLDGRLDNGAWAKGASGLRKGGQLSVLEAFDGSAKVTKPSSQEEKHDAKRQKVFQEYETAEVEREEAVPKDTAKAQLVPESPSKLPPEQQIFRNLTIYINGSTFPLISDHKLKRLLAEHGARLSIALGRRTVTHVIIGNPNIGGGIGAGGGLASTKIQKEIAKVKGCGIKFVSVDWVLESMKAGKRLPEASFSCLKLATKGQQSMLGLFGK